MEIAFRRVIVALDNNKIIRKFNILEAMYMLTRAWAQVLTNTIVNCFKNAEVSATLQIEGINDSDKPFSDLKYQIDELTRILELTWWAYVLLPTLFTNFSVVIAMLLYYGQTECHLQVRAGEHIRTSPLTGRRVNNNRKTSVKDHCLLSGHVCVHLMILQSRIMSHTSSNVWL